MSWPGIRVTLGASSERWVRRPTSSTVLAIIAHGLAHGGQGIGRPGGHGDVVEADHGEILGQGQPEFAPGGIDDADGEDVIGAEHRIGPRLAGEEAAGGGIACLIAEGAGFLAQRLRQAAGEAARTEALPAIDIGRGIRPSRHIGQAPVAAVDQMIGQLPPAAVLSQVTAKDLRSAA